MASAMEILAAKSFSLIYKAYIKAGSGTKTPGLKTDYSSNLNFYQFQLKTDQLKSATIFICVIHWSAFFLINTINLSFYFDKYVNDEVLGLAWQTLVQYH